MPLEKYKADLAELKARDRLRSLSGESGLDFSSNDYLALSRAPSIRRALEEALAEGIAIGSGGSRLLRGNHPAHEELESKAAAFFGAERTLYFTSGYAANFTIFSALPKRGDLVIFDELLHASSREGIHSGLAKRCKVPHNDLEAFDDALRKWHAAGGKGQPWMAVESLYSMDGDFAPIAGLVELADRYDAMLVVDEAHATGVHGPLGRGLTAPYEGRENLIVVPHASTTGYRDRNRFGARTSRAGVRASRPSRDWALSR